MKTNPKILLHPNIPKPLHGIAPRVVLGKNWWDVERHKAYEKADFCCEACGIPKSKAMYHQWLEAHEFYEYNYEKGRLKLIRLVALCHSCHNFIHNGRMQMMVEDGRMDEEKYKDILAHGMGIIIRSNLQEQYEDRHEHEVFAKWSDWRMEIEGKLYGPSSKDLKSWMNGDWRKWKP